MTKALASYPEEHRVRIATRRLAGRDRGNGFWAAKDFFTKKGMRLPGHLGKQQDIAEAMKASKNGDNAPMTAFVMRERGNELRRKPPVRKNFRPRGGSKLGSAPGWRKR